MIPILLLLALIPIFIISVSAETTLYGMVRVDDSPSTYQLSIIDISSGNITKVGSEPPRVELVGGPTSGLSSIYNNVFYFMGDNGTGTTKVVGLRLSDSTEVCSVTIPELAECGFVGAGATLDIDYNTGNLVATGPSIDDSKTHVSFSIDPVQCTVTSLSSTYGNGDAYPLCHGNTMNQGFLYTTVQDSSTGNYGVQVVDISNVNSEKKNENEDTFVIQFDGNKAIWGLNWLNDRLIGIAQDSSGSLVVNGIEGLPSYDTSWDQVLVKDEIKKGKKHYNQLWGNDGAVSTVITNENGQETLFFLASQGPGSVTGVDIVGLDPRDGRITSAATLNGDAYNKFGGSCIYNLEAVRTTN
jgi:hypothetical protein